MRAPDRDTELMRRAWGGVLWEDVAGLFDRWEAPVMEAIIRQGQTRARAARQLGFDRGNVGKIYRRAIAKCQRRFG